MASPTPVEKFSTKWMWSGSPDYMTTFYILNPLHVFNLVHMYQKIC